MKILVTGAAGFIGMHLCLRLLEQGHDVVGIDNLNDYYDIKLKQDRLQLLKKDHFVFYPIDISEKEAVFQLFNAYGFEIVCHLAAQAGVRYSITHPDTYIRSNILGFFHILESCRNYSVQHLIYASSSSVYGNYSQVPYSIQSCTDEPLSLYAATKKADELMAYTYSNLYGFRATGLRFFTVYGPWGRPDMAPFLFTDAILNNRPIKVYNQGEMWRDFTYIDDIINGIESVIHTPAQTPHRLFNLGNSQPVKLTDFIRCIERETGKTAQKEFLPMQQGDVLQTFADLTESREILDYHPQVGIEEGVGHFVDWFRNYYPNEKHSFTKDCYENNPKQPILEVI